MTAEAVVMNKSAVAMAADSAVTISGARGGVKTYDTVNKLFELIKGSNIGVMVYSNAEINDMPWESIVKFYRSERVGVRFDHVEDYVEDFTNFIAASKLLLSPASDLKVVIESAYFQQLAIFAQLDARRLEWITLGGRPIKSRARTIVKETLDDLEEGYQNALPDAPWVSGLPAAQLKREYVSEISALVDQQFDQFDLSATTRKRIVDLCLLGLRKCLNEPSESGLVLSGFGDKDYLPKLYSSRVRGRVSGVLRVAHPEWTEVTIDEPGQVQTFAQDEQAWGFLSGINHEVRNSVIEYWSNWLRACASEIPDLISKAAPRLATSTVSDVASAIQEHLDADLDGFLEYMNRRQERLYLGPVIQSIAALPKDELAIFAESLVNLTSLKQKMSIYHAQTVGGPIDLALISPGDGFVWIKRKHYFTQDLNPTWHLTRRAII